jgi:hypothetical protein
VIRRILLFAFVLSSAGIAHAQDHLKALERSEVADLITLGRANKIGHLDYTCQARKPSTGFMVGMTGLYGFAAQQLMKGNNVFDVTMTGARGRIALNAREAALADRTMADSEIADSDLDQALYVTVSPRLPNEKDTGEGEIPAKILGIKLVAKEPARDRVIAPDGPIQQTPKTWRNAAAATVDYSIAQTTFGRIKLGSISSGPMVLALDTEAGGRVCELTEEDIVRLLKARK